MLHITVMSLAIYFCNKQWRYSTQHKVRFTRHIQADQCPDFQVRKVLMSGKIRTFEKCPEIRTFEKNMSGFFRISTKIVRIFPDLDKKCPDFSGHLKKLFEILNNLESVAIQILKTKKIEFFLGKISQFSTYSIINFLQKHIWHNEIRVLLWQESCANAAAGEATLGLNAREQLTKCIKLMKKVLERNQEFEIKWKVGLVP